MDSSSVGPGHLSFPNVIPIFRIHALEHGRGVFLRMLWGGRTQGPPFFMAFGGFALGFRVSR